MLTQLPQKSNKSYRDLYSYLFIFLLENVQKTVKNAVMFLNVSKK